MESLSSLTYSNYADKKPLFTNAAETIVTSTSDTFAAPERNISGNQSESGFSPMAPAFQSRARSERLGLPRQQEPRSADTAPTAAEIEEVLMYYRINNNPLFDDNAQANASNFGFLGNATNNRPESVASSNMWSEGAASNTDRSNDMLDTFDFLVKSLSSAHNYVSMLTREQLSVLKSIRPSLLYELLLEVAKVRSDKWMRRALPNECAFCKNNGENEECYSDHVLKDGRGRVLCPVLRAFRCPRCGATGERAHTIKYCPYNTEGDRAGVSGRRRAPPSSLVLGAPLVAGLASSMSRSPQAAASPAAPASSPVPSTGLAHSSIWE